MFKDNLIYKIISRIFDPIILAPVAIIVAIYQLNIKILPAILIGLSAVGIPTSYFFINILNGTLDIDMTDRVKRLPLFRVIIASQLAAIGIAFLLGYKEISLFLLILAIALFVILLITHTWKISVHSFANTALLGYLGVAYALEFLIIMPIIVGVVGYARVKLNKHTPNQIIGGFILGCINTCILYLII